MRTLTFFSLLASVTAMAGIAADHTIEQKDRKFSQSQIEIHVGDKLIFTNSDEVTHNVYSATPGLEFEIKRQAPGGSRAFLLIKRAPWRCAALFIHQ